MLAYWRIAVAVLLGALTLVTFALTGQMLRLEAGLQQNLEAAQALVRAQSAIRERNTLLADLLGLTGGIGEGLDGVVRRSEAISQHAAAILQANRALLDLNLAVEQQTGATADDLERVSASLNAVDRSASSIRDSLADLRDTVAADAELLESIAASTARMNQRTPGW